MSLINTKVQKTEVQKIYELCKKYDDSLRTIEDYKICFALHKGGNRKEFTERLNKLRAESIEKKRKLIESIKNL